jgi:hypothetical protein
MTYIPGSKLSYILGGIQHAMVLSDNKVMCLSGLFLGQIMLLVDWLILAAGTEQQSNTFTEAHDIWTHAKQKAGIDPPSLAHVDEDYEMSTKLPQLLVPPMPQLASSCCDTAFACGCLELSGPAAPPAVPPAAPELAASPLAQSSASHLPEPAAQSSASHLPEPAAQSSASHLPEPAAQSSASHLPELRFPPPLGEPAPVYPKRHVGDKLKWELNDETYRIAVFTNKGVFEVKNVEDGGAAVHNNECTCSPCSDYKMVPRAPWQPRLPLAKAFFETEAAWRASLPQGGKFYTKYVTSRYKDWV